MLNQDTITKLQAAHADDDLIILSTALTAADQCNDGKPVENDGAGWVTWTGTEYPALESIPWQARGSVL